MSDENSLISAHEPSSFAPSAAETVSADRSEASNQFEHRRPEEEQADSSAPKSQSLSDEHLEIDTEAKVKYEAKQSHRENLERLASELGVEDLHVPSKIAAYSAETILKVMGEYGFEVEDFRSPAKVTSMLAALEQEAEEAEAAELESVRQSLESEDEDSDSEDSEQEETEEAPEPTDEEEAKPEEQAQPTERPQSIAELTPEQAEAMQAHITEVATRASPVNDPVYTEYFGRALAHVLDIAPEHDAKFQAVAQVLQFGAQSLLETILPGAIDHFMRQNFHSVMESYAPGFATSYTEQTLARTWNDVAGNDLPKYGTPEFIKLRDEISAKHSFLDGIDFTHDPKTGKPLSDLEALKMKASLVAQLCRNQKVSPQHFQNAIEKAKADAASTHRRVSAGRSLGAGRTTGTLSNKETHTSLVDAYYARKSNSFDEEK